MNFARSHNHKLLSTYSFSLITFLVYFKVNSCFKIRLNGTSALAEDKEIEMLIIISITTLKRSSKKCGRNEVFDLVQSSLGSDITREAFDELLQDMIEVNAVKLRTLGERECLSLPKEEPKDLDMTTNRTISDLATFQLQLDNFKSRPKEQFSSFKQSFIAAVSQFKNDFLQKQATNTDRNTIEKLFQQMVKEISFLHDELKNKNTVINLLLET